MFTGIITDIGILQKIEKLDKGLKLGISTNYDTSGLDIGASIACNGICLTMVAKLENLIFVEAWTEALALTTLTNWRLGDKINLERSLRIGEEIGGHLVSGHVDATAQIFDKKQEGEAVRFYLKAPNELSMFIAQKGSVALDGTSLTINSVNENMFDVLIIKHTLSVTNWCDKDIGSQVNIEIDQLARYCVRYAQLQEKGRPNA